MMAGTDSLFHYTGLHALRGILNQRQIWVTGIHHQEDRDELERARREMEAQLQPIHGPIDLGFSMHMDPNSRGKKFFGIACFSQVDDDRYQWDNYTPAGEGVAIRVNRQRLCNLADCKRFCLVECIYDEDVMRAQIREFLTRHRFTQPVLPMHGLQAYVLTEAARFKGPRFVDENEVRLLSPPYGGDPDLPPLEEPIKTYTNAHGASIPYLPFPMCDDDGWIITGVRLGPSSAPHMKQSVEEALKSAGLMLPVENSAW